MTKAEFGTFTAALKTYYPREKDLLPNDAAMQLWYKQLHDIPFPVAEAALDKWVALNKYSPSIAEFREVSATVVHAEAADWGEAWGAVLDAIRRHGLYGQRQAMESLDELTRRAVQAVGWRELCLSDNVSVERANFRSIYQDMVTREKAQQQMGEALQQRIALMQGRNPALSLEE